MRELRTEIEINAEPEIVWEVLTDFNSYPDWNPFVVEMKGEVKVGNRIEVLLKPPGKKEMTFKPVVLKLDSPKEFRWKGSLPIPGMFVGEHIFQIEDLSDKEKGPKVMFIHREEFKGLLVGMLWKDLNSNTRAGFESMNQALKKRCEEK